jgi:hypothetical protein
MLRNLGAGRVFLVGQVIFLAGAQLTWPPQSVMVSSSTSCSETPLIGGR